MGAIKLKSGTKVQDFENEKGKKLSLKINIGDTDLYIQWIKKAGELKDIGKDLSDTEAIIKLKPLSRELITMLFGKGKYNKISRFCGGNVFAIMEIIKVFTSIITEGVNENVK